MSVAVDELPGPLVPPEPEPIPPVPEEPPAAPEPSNLPTPLASAVPLYYCMSNDHSWYPKDESRFFGYEGEGCPTCPQCNKQVTAVPVNALGEYPAVVSNLTGGH